MHTRFRELADRQPVASPKPGQHRPVLPPRRSTLHHRFTPRRWRFLVVATANRSTGSGARVSHRVVGPGADSSGPHGSLAKGWLAELA